MSSISFLCPFLVEHEKVSCWPSSIVGCTHSLMDEDSRAPMSPSPKCCDGNVPLVPPRPVVFRFLVIFFLSFSYLETRAPLLTVFGTTISPFQQTFHLLVSPIVVLLLWQGEMMYKPRELCGVYNTQTRRWGQFLTSRRQGYTKIRTIRRRKKEKRVGRRSSKIFIWFFQPRRRCHSRFHSFVSIRLGICFVLLFPRPGIL